MNEPFPESVTSLLYLHHARLCSEARDSAGSPAGSTVSVGWGQPSNDFVTNSEQNTRWTWRTWYTKLTKTTSDIQNLRTWLSLAGLRKYFINNHILYCAIPDTGLQSTATCDIIKKRSRFYIRWNWHRVPLNGHVFASWLRQKPRVCWFGKYFRPCVLKFVQIFTNIFVTVKKIAILQEYFIA